MTSRTLSAATCLVLVFVADAAAGRLEKYTLPPQVAPQEPVPRLVAPSIQQRAPPPPVRQPVRQTPAERMSEPGELALPTPAPNSVQRRFEAYVRTLSSAKKRELYKNLSAKLRKSVAEKKYKEIKYYSDLITRIH